MAATQLSDKSVSDYVVEFVKNAIDGWGHTRMILMADQETTMAKLGAEVKDEPESQAEDSGN